MRQFTWSHNPVNSQSRKPEGKVDSHLGGKVSRWQHLLRVDLKSISSIINNVSCGPLISREILTDIRVLYVATLSHFLRDFLPLSFDICSVTGVRL